MKKQSIKELLKRRSAKIGCVMLAAVLAIGGGMIYYETQNTVPELVTFVDAEDTIQIAEDEVPLAAPKVTKTSKTTKKTKRIKMKSAAKRTYTKAGKAKTTTKTATKKTSASTTTTRTVTTTRVTNQYRKGSKINTQVTTTRRIVTKTVTPKSSSSSAKTSGTTKTSSAGSSSGSAQKTSSTAAPQSGTVSITQVAPLVGSNVSNAFQKLGFKITINPNVSYSGLCDARTRTITLKRSDNTVYHELGHFVAFVAGNADTSSAFKAVYNSEKSLYKEYNKNYILSNSSEYFAESYRNYVLTPSALKASRPQTYAAIKAALGKITDTQVSKILDAYSVVWNK